MLIEKLRQKNPNEKIAILVRSRTHLTSLLPALKEATISYQAIDIEPLGDRQTIRDLLSLTSALLHPADRIAWLAILRAPWCGITLADLFLIAGNHPQTAILELLDREDIIARLSSDGQHRIAKFLCVIKTKIAERERTDLRSWIENTWLLLGGPACLQGKTQIEDANSFFVLLEEMHFTYQTMNPDSLKEKITQLFASNQSDDPTLQIMTIHSAKGLEFDTVILPHLERKNPQDDKSLLLWMERPVYPDQMALLLAPIHAMGDESDSIYDYIYRQHRIKSRYETDRLFYVAATRAKKNLYLYFNTSQNEKGDYRIEVGSFLLDLLDRHYNFGSLPQ